MTILKQSFQISITENRAGILALPDDIATNPVLCPLIVFCHGAGEAATSVNTATVDALYNNGSPLALARDGMLSSVICPITGQVYRPVVFGLQGLNGKSVEAKEIVYAIRQLLALYPKIDLSNIMITGLSAGAETVWEAIGGPNGSMFVAAVPMSTPAINLGLVNWSSNSRTKVVAFHGDQDTGLTDYWGSIRYVTAVNTAYPGHAALITVVGIGHGGWAINYGPSTRIWINTDKGLFNRGLSIYEFQLACRNANLVSPISLNFGSSPSNIQAPITSNLKATFTTLVEGNNITLDPTLSTAVKSITSSGWFISQNGNYIKPNILSGQVDNGIGIPGRLIISLPSGTYDIRLTLNEGDTKAISTKTIIVGTPLVINPTIIEVFTDNGITYTLYSDGTYKKS